MLGFKGSLGVRCKDMVLLCLEKKYDVRMTVNIPMDVGIVQRVISIEKLATKNYRLFEGL